MNRPGIRRHRFRGPGRYLETRFGYSEFKIGYHEGTLADVVACHRNPPVELPADAGAVKAEIERWLEK